ncbi:MAG: hypothetical protein LBC82_03330 [Oscillospiraceae bacterium]|nr:hypothetical protein [Oscillospiraceae bacterium]
MKKFVLCLFAAMAVFALSTGAFAIANNNNHGGTANNGTGVVGAAENIVGGVVNGAENVVGGVADGVRDIVGAPNNHNNHNYNNHNNNHAANPVPHANNVAEHARNDRNPATGLGFGLIEFAVIGTTMLGTAALANGKKRR